MRDGGGSGRASTAAAGGRQRPPTYLASTRAARLDVPDGGGCGTVSEAAQPGVTQGLPSTTREGKEDSETKNGENVLTVIVEDAGSSSEEKKEVIGEF